MIKKILKSLFIPLNLLAKKFGYTLSINKSGTGEYFSYSNVDSFDPDDPIMRIYEESIEYVEGKSTDNVYKKMRYQIMMQLLEKVVKEHPELDAAECGCWNGHSTRMCSTRMSQLGFRGEFHVFDSFEGGLSEFTENDRVSKTTITKEQEEAARVWFESSYEAVKRRLSEFDFVKLYKGWIPVHFNRVSDRKFGFVNIDVDMYDPILDSLQFFYPRLVDGGFIYLDDYNYTGFPGAKHAVDDFMKEHKPSFFVFMPCGSAFIIK